MHGRGFQADAPDEILSQINVIPLVDISLVLLLIFMVTANYIMTSSLTVDIPQAKHAKNVQQNEVKTITISREGPLYLENELVTTSELRTKMESAYGSNPNLSIILSADKNVSFKNIVKVLDLLSGLGINKISISAITE
jgi:biopolymer transport protein TolR